MNAFEIVLLVLIAGAIAGGFYFLHRLLPRPVMRDESDEMEAIRMHGPPPVVPPPDPEAEGSWVRALTMEVVIVHTDIGLSYEGLLVLESPKGLLLRNPKLLDDKRSPTTMAGELWIDRVKVHAVQTKPVDLAQLPSAS